MFSVVVNPRPPTLQAGMVSPTVAASVLRSARCNSMKAVNKRGWAIEVGTIYGALCYRIVDVSEDMNPTSMSRNPSLCLLAE